MSTRALQTAIANTLGEAQERTRRLELAIQDLERRVTDIEGVMYEQFGCDTQSEIGSTLTVSTAKYCAPKKTSS